MAHILADRVRETTTDAGTGVLILSGAYATNCQRFSAVCAIGDTFPYAILHRNNTEWETGIGTYSATNTITRTRIDASSNGGSAVVFSSGIKDVILAVDAKSIPPYDPITGLLNPSTLGVVSSSHGGTGLSSIGTANQVLAVNPAGTALEYHTITSNPGTVTSVSGTGTINGLTLSGTVTSSGNLTLGGSLSNVNLASQVTGTLPVANGGTGSTTAQAAINTLAGATTSGQYLRGNGTNVVMSAIQAADVPTLNQNTTGTAANVTGVVAVVNGGTGVTTSTGSGDNVLATSPTLVTPKVNAISSVAVVSGAGNNLTLTAGSGVTSGAGGNIILQPGAQATTGGDGKIRINTAAGVDTGWNLTNTYASYPTLDQARFYLRNGTNTQIIEFRADLGLLSCGTNNSYIWLGSNNANLVGIRENANSGTIGVICGSTTTGGSFNFPSATTTLVANANDLALSASAFQRVSCTTNPYSITGIAPVTGTGSVHKDGRMIRIYNVGTPNLTLSHNSTSSIVPANRFYNSTGADIILGSNRYAELIYDNTNNGSGSAGWRVAGPF